MVNNDTGHQLISRITEVTGLLASILVGFVIGLNLVSGDLTLPVINQMGEVILGWVITLLTLIAAIFRIIPN